MTPPRLPLAAVLAPHRQNAVSPAMRTYTRPLCSLPRSGNAIGGPDWRRLLSSFLALRISRFLFDRSTFYPCIPRRGKAA